MRSITRRSLLAATLAGIVLAAPSGQPLAAAALPGPLVTTDWLAAHAGEVRVLDVRADTDSYYGRSKEKVAVQGHIPGAVLVPWARIREKRKEGDVELVGMVLPAERFEALARELGVRRGEPLVITSRGESSGDITFATRLYWTFRYYGHDAVAILDGGTLAWKLAGHPLETAAVSPTPGDFVAGPGREDLYATTEEVMQALETGAAQLVDARTPDFYRGEKVSKGVVFAAGHIRGARNLPHPEMFVRDAAGALRFRTGDDALALLAAHGIDPQLPTYTYCNTGHLGSGAWFFLAEIVGNGRTELYDGSMHEWTISEARRSLVVAGAE